MKTITDLEKMRICELVEDLIGHGLRGAITRYDGHHNFYRWQENYKNYLHRIHCETFCGVTRTVFVFDDLDWVIKINFINPLMDDYNYLEYSHFQSAIKAGLEKYFAAMWYVDEIDGICIYAQEKVNVDEDSVSSSFFEYTLENYYNQASKNEDGEWTEDQVNEAAWDESYTLENEDRIYAMITDGMANELISFIQENDINDLHSGNWGYRGDEPVLIDYAGY